MFASQASVMPRPRLHRSSRRQAANSKGNEERSAYAINSVTLRFDDQNLERRFVEEHLGRNLGLQRLTIVLGALVYAIFGLLDTMIIPEILTEAWIIRYGVVCPVLIALVLFSYTRYFHYARQWILATTILSTGLGLIVMIALADAPGNNYYYAGLLVVCAYATAAWRLGHIYSSSMLVFLLGAYEVTVWFINPIAMRDIISNTSFLFLAVSVQIWLNYTLERQIRLNFIDKEHIRHANVEAERLLREAQAANHAKNEFLAVMSHELRTPLNAVIGFSEVIEAQMLGPVGEPKYVEYAGDIKASGQHLLDIISGILDLSKAEAGKLELTEEDVDIGDLLNHTLRMFRQRAAEEGIRLSFEFPPEPVILRADARLLNQAVINLVSNALKFTQRGGAVSVSITTEKCGELCLRVKDTGIGIAPAHQTKIFEPFVQVETAMNRSKDGTGLGLPLVRHIIALHGGTLNLQSALGEGTAVTIRFTRDRLVSPRPEETPVRDAALDHIA